MLKHAETCWNMLKHAETCWNMLKHAETCWNCSNHWQCGLISRTCTVMAIIGCGSNEEHGGSSQLVPRQFNLAIWNPHAINTIFICKLIFVVHSYHPISNLLQVQKGCAIAMFDFHLFILISHPLAIPFWCLDFRRTPPLRPGDIDGKGMWSREASAADVVLKESVEEILGFKVKSATRSHGVDLLVYPWSLLYHGCRKWCIHGPYHEIMCFFPQMFHKNLGVAANYDSALGTFMVRGLHSRCNNIEIHWNHHYYHLQCFIMIYHNVQ